MKKIIIILIALSTFSFSNSSFLFLGYQVTKSVTTPIIFSVETLILLKEAFESYQTEQTIEQIEKENCSLQERYENEYVMNCVKKI